MRKKVSNRILGRSADERLHLMRLLTSSLLEHGAINTSEAKAKELRRHFEPLVTRAKAELTLTNRRMLIAKLADKAELPQLLAVAKKNKKRPGGYLRITKLPVIRSDAAHMAHVEIL